MIEHEEYMVSSDQLVANLDEMVRMIDWHMLRIKQMLSSNEITHHQDRALFHAMNLMLRERKELIEEKDRVLNGARVQPLMEDAS